VKDVRRSVNSVPTPDQNIQLKPAETRPAGTYEGPRFMGNVARQVASRDEYATLQEKLTAIRNSQPGGS
jgi:hypothetical protein